MPDPESGYQEVFGSVANAEGPDGEGPAGGRAAAAGPGAARADGRAHVRRDGVGLERGAAAAEPAESGVMYLDDREWCGRTWSNGPGNAECECDLPLGHDGPHWCCCGLGRAQDGADDDRVVESE